MTTRYSAEVVLYQRWAGALQFVFQRDADPVTGDFPVTNQPVVPDPSAPTAIYNDPLGYGLRLTGHVPADASLVTDADLAAGAGRWDMLIDLADYRLANSILGSFTDVTESDFGRSASYNQYADRIQKRIDALYAQLKPFINPYRQGASSGAIRSIPATAFAPRWRPGYGGPTGWGRGFGGGC